MELGLSSYTFGWAVGVHGHEPACPLDEHGLLDKCQQHGIHSLQIGDNLPLHTFDGSRLDALAMRAAEQRVKLEIGARRLTVERATLYCAIARRLGAKLLRFVIDDADYRPTADSIITVLQECKQLLQGLTLGIENHDRFSSKVLRNIIESAADDRIGICLDTANSIGAGEGLETVLRELGALTVNLHIKDFRIDRVSHKMGFTVTGQPAGSGMLEVPEILRALSAFGRCGSAIIELWTPPEPRLEETIAKEASWAVQSVAYLKPFFP
jgi:3-oxoisoapionate decarboxylase